MRSKRTLTILAASVLSAAALAQSDGRSFDAAVVVTPGMALERGTILVDGGWQSSLLRHGDVVYTDGFTSGHIITSDGTVIGLGNGAAVAIDGRQIGFDVFRVQRGYASILGNVYNGYPMPPEFSGRIPFRFGNVTVFPEPVPFPPVVSHGGAYVVPGFWSW